MIMRERKSKSKTKERERKEKMSIPQFIALKTYLALLPSSIAWGRGLLLKQIVVVTVIRFENSFMMEVVSCRAEIMKF